MARLRVREIDFDGKVPGLSYPCADDLKTVLDAGGLSHLSEEILKGVRKRERKPKPGEWCDDMPAGSVAHQLRRGRIEQVEDAEAAESEETIVGRLRRRTRGESR